MKPPYQRSGTTGFFDTNNEWRCAGSMMGRRNVIPCDYNGEKLNLRKVPFVDSCYDQGGAYWGAPANLWCAWGDTETEQLDVFVRADDRQDAKVKIAKAMRYTVKEIPKFKS